MKPLPVHVTSSTSIFSAVMLVSMVLISIFAGHKDVFPCLRVKEESSRSSGSKLAKAIEKRKAKDTNKWGRNMFAGSINLLGETEQAKIEERGGKRRRGLKDAQEYT